MKSTFLLTLIIPMLAITGCNKRKGELTRELAAELLNEHLAAHPVLWCRFKDGYFDPAIRDGVIERVWVGEGYRFTYKGIKMVGAVIAENHMEIEFSPPLGMKPLKFWLKKDFGERVQKVTGIKEGQSPGTKEVEYETEHPFPPEMQSMKHYITNGQIMKSVFQKYDDGWRITKATE